MAEITVKALPNHPRAQEIVDAIAKSISLQQENRHVEALQCIEAAILIDPGFFPALVQKGAVLLDLARYEEAIECFDLFLKKMSDPKVRELRQKSFEHALANYDSILSKTRANAEILVKRGDILQRLNRYEESVYTYNLALEIHVGHLVNILNRRGNSLLCLERPLDALESYDRALELSPGNSSLFFNRGNVLQGLGRIDEAIESYDRALQYNPELAEAKMERSHCLLVSGNFQEGFREYESRWENAQLKPARLKTSTPLWLGKESLAGKTILLWAEQGFGDTIQFLRYVPMVAGMAGSTILRVPIMMLSLAKSLDCPASVISFMDELPPHDLNCPLMSLPLALGTTLDSIPAEIPYLSAGVDLVRKWRDLLGPRTKPRIGLAWAGRRREPVNRTRDMGLEDLAPLLNLDIEIVSLQKEIPDHDRQFIETVPGIARWGEKVTDFGDTAALIQNLDIVISVDSAMAHLAGALGKPVLILLRHSGEWRWLLKRSDSPWYPTARIFRQKAYGDWPGVVAAVTGELKAMLNSRA